MRLSGDQNGIAASAVSGSIRAVNESRGRTHSAALAEASYAIIARFFPSGEMAEDPIVVPSGGKMETRRTDSCCEA